ncbi:MAG: NAD(P)H-hydrate dehydratase [Alphaproteobacteria bacterium]|nr:NAD(P)H-hydrate dehydratase [Alphaproteobacteria bacterium]
MEILSVKEMYQADRAAMEGGVASLDLMEAAGAAVAVAIEERWDKRPVCVLAGPGNNGGDGYVVARLLKTAGWDVTVYQLGEKNALSGDAAVNAKLWRAKVRPLDDALDLIAGQGEGDSLLVVDALFGAGLSRPLEGTARILAELLTVSQAQGNAPLVVAVDVPSGLHGDTARAMGADKKSTGVCFHADLTVTFCRAKPAHVLLPGRSLCGEVVVADIGIADAEVDRVAPMAWINGVGLWRDAFPDVLEDANKYARGHLVVLGGAGMTGAARLAAMGGRRAGAGLVTIACPDKAFAVYAAATQPGTLIQPFRSGKDFAAILADARKTTMVLGPGAGVAKATRQKILAALAAGKRCVLDADALTVFRDAPKALFRAVSGRAHPDLSDVVLTPHGGEFPRLFPDLAKKYAAAKLGKIEATREAARRSGCVVLYKGPSTVVAAPDGRAAVTVNAPQWLATAGSGDVLAGMIGALLAQGMPAFEAANAAAWMHGEAAMSAGPGLIAEDLPDALPEIVAWLIQQL